MPAKMKRLLAPATLFILFFISLLSSCNPGNTKEAESKNSVSDKRDKINIMLDSFNRAAAKADYNAYFNFFTDDAIFTGTDATERWNKKEFMIWAKPFFDRGRAWSFTSMGRHIYFDSTGTIAWFDELLNTQMKICRGSGVVVKKGPDWKVEQYILSATIPNGIMDAVVKMKASAEDSIINKLIHH
ncbi:MAG: nuclear transport factor 2 family protein [Chitinophagaceae bacterium]|nr:nuclear transport factor 2 family protein [Chitinophagaceae bacterium]